MRRLIDAGGEQFFGRSRFTERGQGPTGPLLFINRRHQRRGSNRRRLAPSGPPKSEEANPPIGRSPRGPGRRTQRIKARLLFVAQRIVEFREHGLHRLHCGKRGLEALLDRLDPAGGRQHLVRRAAGLKPFPCLDGRILQFIESRPLLGRGLYRLGDAIDRQVGSCPADNGC